MCLWPSLAKLLSKDTYIIFHAPLHVEQFKAKIASNKRKANGLLSPIILEGGGGEATYPLHPSE